jgi:hypothetical protein
MRLGLSSAAAPDADLEELTAACIRRGLAGVELRHGDAHGVGIERNALDRAAALARAAAAGIAITGYRVDEAGDPLRLARLATSLDTPLLLDGADEDRAVAARLEAALRLQDRGAAAAVVVRGAGAVRQAQVIAAAGVPVAWDADPGSVPLAPLAERLLGDCAEALRHIRLIGGGPETAVQEGRGVGALMGRLALGGYAGELVLAPSAAGYHIAWQNWLGRRGGWGCGSRADAAPLPLAAPLSSKEVQQ